MNRSEALLQLYELKFKDGQDVDRMIEIALSKEELSLEVIEFLQGRTYKPNELVEKLKGKKLYKVLESLSDDESTTSDVSLAKMMSSIVTHCLIEVEQESIKVEDLNESYGIKHLVSILDEYIDKGILDKLKLIEYLSKYKFLLKKVEVKDQWVIY